MRVRASRWHSKLSPASPALALPAPDEPRASREGQGVEAYEGRRGVAMLKGAVVVCVAAGSHRPGPGYQQ
ncbi:hypothetical protein E2C01_063938 [Portunus trituberculatus]|uniref:Uncharacterized protein n=1 Tax=Portunus trituberculatus TaxID=210409 RepID=A0A5B7HIE9_PORTR|nr:hypothetical protein [Portunus trituberculatus]